MLNPSLIKELRKIAGPGHVFTSPEDLIVYSYDATRMESMPEAVVRPATAREVSEIVLLANRRGFPVVPRGAGSGMSGGSVPVKGGVIISLERMNKIISIKEDDMIAEVEPGVVTGEFQRKVEAKGLFYPPDPGSRDFCTIGGNVAECAGGLRAVKYGVTRDYVLGMEVVIPTGDIVFTGARTMKSVAGYDLTRLIIGSEGTLGIMTMAVLKLLPLPESVGTLGAFFPDVAGAASAASTIISMRMLPRALEIMDGYALRAVEGYLKKDVSGGAGAMLVIEVDGPAVVVEQDMARIERILREAGSSAVLTATEAAERENIWKARRAISPALYAIKPNKINEDIVVPRSKVSAILSRIDEIGRRRGLLIVNFGHAGDGNIHTNIMIEEDERSNAEAAVGEIFEAVLSMNGSISGEHGIGISKAAYLPMEVGSAALDAMKNIKKSLDPNNVMNPGKIF